MKKAAIAIILACFSLYYLLPLIGTVLYASSTKWSKSLLPDDFTFKWFQQLFNDPTFLAAVGRSFLLSVLVLLTILGIMVPSIIWINLFLPRVSQIMEKLVLLPYAIPGVILVTALLRTYSKTSIPMFFVLIGALFISALPIVFLGITNQMRLINMKELLEAASTLGAPTPMIILRVLFPTIRTGTILVSLMIFSSVFGEYLLTNLLIGGRFETVRIYMLRRMNENGHLSSAVIVLYFLFILIIALLTFVMTNRQKKQVVPIKQRYNRQSRTLEKGVVVDNVLEHS
ncbi:ABC transporter permease [Enterococcus silesiacus]|uniref:ABC transporter permease n=1 Tax=Enterococcus silesiacus TaxID=332949 RepID=UPI000B1DC9E3|nr:ABC transporter permease [Enterococcus silesiacus]